jgi:hypothetical protein
MQSARWPERRAGEQERTAGVLQNEQDNREECSHLRPTCTNETVPNEPSHDKCESLHNQSALVIFQYSLSSQSLSRSTIW